MFKWFIEYLANLVLNQVFNALNSHRAKLEKEYLDKIYLFENKLDTAVAKQEEYEFWVRSHINDIEKRLNNGK